MNRLKIKAFYGAGNVSSFGVADEAGNALDLGALGNAVVTVSVTNPIEGQAAFEITSQTTDVYFVGSELFVKFGRLNLPSPPGEVTYYYPTISYVHDAMAEPTVITAQSYLTEIMLGAVK